MRNILVFLLSLIAFCSSAQSFDFYGYEGTELGTDKIVRPKTPAAGNPWVIRARFWGHEPGVDTALLARGFFITYCDVADLYGSPEAVKRYDEFYKKMTDKFALSKKVVLEGMSRGGLIVYNWAAQNAEKVAAIYADAPVMDIKSWPMKNSALDTRQMMAAYGFTDTAQVMAWRGNPVDHAAALIKIPIIHVVGSADDVVPVAENTDLFKTRYQKAGGFITVVRKKGVGHHPHSLKDPTTIVNFLMNACGLVENPCTVAVPAFEWRSGAGWRQGVDWWENHIQISELASAPTDILLLGNSITQGFGGRSLVSYEPGRHALDSVMSVMKCSWIAAGISGDRTQNLLWRLQNGDYGKCDAKDVFITIGVNNLVAGNSPAQVAQGIVAVARQAAITLPNAHITLFGILPFSGMESQRAVQAILATAELPSNVDFVDPTQYFTVDGKLVTEYYSGDRLHLSEAGYARFSRLLQVVRAHRPL